MRAKVLRLKGLSPTKCNIYPHVAEDAKMLHLIVAAKDA
jgi:hypothetical protein